MNSLKCPMANSLSRCLTDLFPIYQNDIWTIPSSHSIEDCRISHRWSDLKSFLCKVNVFGSFDEFKIIHFLEKFPWNEIYKYQYTLPI